MDTKIPFTNDYLAGWLSGFFDGEGGCYFGTYGKSKYVNYKISAANNDKVLIDFASNALSKLGIDHKIYKHRLGNYSIVIHRKEEIIKFSSLINFHSPSKQQRLEEIIKWCKKTKERRYKAQQKATNTMHQSSVKVARNNLHAKLIMPNEKASFFGDKHPRAKLTSKEVLDIRKTYATGKWTHRELAEKYNISSVQIGRIILRKSWTHI